MEIADRRALIQYVNHNFIRGQQLRVQFLLLLAVRPDSRDERSRCDIFPVQEVLS